MQLFGTVQKGATLKEAQKKVDVQISVAKATLEREKMTVAREIEQLKKHLQDTEAEFDAKIVALRQEEMAAVAHTEQAKKQVGEVAERLQPTANALEDALNNLSSVQEHADALVSALNDQVRQVNNLAVALEQQQKETEEKALTLAEKCKEADERVKRIEASEEALMERLAYAERALSRLSLAEMEMNTTISQEKQAIEAKLSLLKQREEKLRLAERKVQADVRTLKKVKEMYGDRQK